MLKQVCSYGCFNYCWNFSAPVFMAGGAAGLTLGSVAAGSLSGAIASGGMAILGGAKPKDFFKEMAIGAAMGAVSGKLQQGKFEAKSFENTKAQKLKMQEDFWFCRWSTI